MRRHGKHGARVSVALPPAATSTRAPRFTSAPTPVLPAPQHARGHGGEWPAGGSAWAGGRPMWGNSRIAPAISRTVAPPPAAPRAMQRAERLEWVAHCPSRPFARRLQDG